MSWNDERVELLRKLWLEGLSASQIAGELANGITRNAVIGKVHRLGLSGRAKAPAPAPAAARQTAAATPLDRRRRGAPRRARHGRDGGARRDDARRHRARHATDGFGRRRADAGSASDRGGRHSDFRARHRRGIARVHVPLRPLGDPTSADFRFCGAHSPIGEGPYCAYHATIAYQPAQDRRRDRNRGVPRV